MEYNVRSNRPDIAVVLFNWYPIAIAAPPIFLGEIAPFVVLARGIFLGVFSAGKGENEVKIL